MLREPLAMQHLFIKLRVDSSLILFGSDGLRAVRLSVIYMLKVSQREEDCKRWYSPSIYLVESAVLGLMTAAPTHSAPAF